MRIKQLDIYGYGKWVDQRFELNEGLQVFIGQNEAGKSTLMSFIHSILFGFPTRNSIFLRYEPQESSKYGGRIIAEDRVLGEIMIERIHGKVTGDVTVTLEDGTTGSDELLDQLLKGLSRENFQSIYSFSLTDIENVHQLDKSKLSRYLLNIGAHSTDYYLNLVDDFQKSAYDLYRPSGRIPPLNKQLTDIAAQEKKLEKLEQRNESYLELIKSQEEVNEKLEKLEQEEKDLQKQLRHLKEFTKELAVLKEIQSLKDEIAQINLPILKKDGQYFLEEYKKEIKETNETLEKIAVIIKNKEDSFLKPELIGAYQENKQEILTLEQDLPEMIEDLSQLEAVEKQLEENKQQIDELKQGLKIEAQDPSPDSFTTNEQVMIEDWLIAENQYSSQVDAFTMELQEIENQLNLKNQKADQYEELMWEDDYFKEIERQLQLDKKQAVEKPASYLLSKVTGVVGLASILISLIIPLFNQWFVVGVGLLFLLISFLTYQKEKKREAKGLTEAHLSNSLLRNEYEKQRAIQSDWQILLAEIDAIQGSYQTKTEERTLLIKQKNELTDKWRKVLISKSLSTTHLFKDAEKVIEQVLQLKEIEEINKELMKTYSQLSEKLESRMSIVDEVLLVHEDLTLVEKMKHFRMYLKELNQLLETEQAKINELNTLKEKERQLILDLETATTQLNDLLETSGVKTEEEFLALYQKQAERERKKSRMQFLKENAPDFDADKPLPSREELVKKEEKLLEQLKKEAKKRAEIIDQRASIKVNITNLEKDGSYSEALQEFENQKAITQNLVDEWISDKVAAAIIQATLNQVTQERFEEIISEINRYFRLLTDDAYDKVLFKEDELFVQKKDGSVMGVKALSRGTAEPLYVAIRLAYIVKMEDVIRLPVVIDDAFVNFDQRRKENVYRLLDELSDKLQIIYFSFDADLRQEFSASQLIELEE